MITLREIREAISTYRWYIFGVVVMGLMGWGTSYVIDAMNPMNALNAPTAVANTTPPPPAPEPSSIPNWATTETPVPETPFFPPLPVPDTNAEKSVVVLQQEYVHRQASYLRTMAQERNGRRAFGSLTIEQIDDMEKKGITVW